VETATAGVRSVLVLGGTSDIGLATAKALVRRGARRVVLAGRRPDELAAVAPDLREAGAAVETIAFDARETSSHEDFVKETLSGEDVDLVLVAFGVLGDQTRAEDEPEHAVEILDTNATGTASVVLHLASGLRRQGHGIVVFLSSVAGERTRRSNFVYGASKAALDGFALGLGDALRGSGVRVLVVRPGFVRTKMTAHMKAAPFATTPDEVASAIVSALEKGREVIWVPSILRLVMSALRHLPRSIFRRLDV